MPKTILVLAANPIDTSRLRLDQEIREIDNGLQRSRRRDELILRQAWAVRRTDLRRAMLDYKPNIVHFCGHGIETIGIALEDDTGHASLVSPDALAAFFELFVDTVECVVLNACYSEVQADAIAKHIPYVIGMRMDIADTTATEFAVAFYDALGAGESVEFAHKVACNAIQLAGMPEESIPALKSKPGQNRLPNDTAQSTPSPGSNPTIPSTTTEAAKHPDTSPAWALPTNTTAGGAELPLLSSTVPVDAQRDHYTRTYPPMWMVLLLPGFTWVVGFYISIAVLELGISPLLIFAMVGGTISTLLITWFGLSITRLTSRVNTVQLSRITVVFLLGGLVTGFTGLAIWSLSCSFQQESILRQLVGCHDSTKIVWKLGTALGSLVGLAAANALMLIEFGVTGLKKRRTKQPE